MAMPSRAIVVFGGWLGDIFTNALCHASNYSIRETTMFLHEELRLLSSWYTQVADPWVVRSNLLPENCLSKTHNEAMI